MVGTRLLLTLGLVAGCTVPDPSYLGEEGGTASDESQADESSADVDSGADASGGSASSSDTSNTDATTTDADSGPESGGDGDGDGDADTGDGDGDAGDGDSGDGDGDGDGDAFEYTSRNCEDAEPVEDMSAVQAIFNLHCIECHSGPQAPHDQDLSPGNAWASIVNQTSGTCGKIRIIPGDPAASYVLDKLEDVDLCGGTQMPKNEDPLSLDDRNTIQNWICAGAPE